MKRYITLDMQVIAENDLKITHWILLENISFLQNNDTNWCYASRKSMAVWLGVTERGLHKILTKLVDENYIKIHTKTRHLQTTEKYKKLQECKNATQQNKVPIDAEQSSDQHRNKVPTLPIKKELKEREEERSTPPKFKNYMELLDFLKSNGEKNYKIKVKFEDIDVRVSKMGIAYNFVSLNDLPRLQETRFLKYLMNNLDELKL